MIKSAREDVQKAGEDILAEAERRLGAEASEWFWREERLLRFIFSASEAIGGDERRVIPAAIKVLERMKYALKQVKLRQEREKGF